MKGLLWKGYLVAAVAYALYDVNNTRKCDNSMSLSDMTLKKDNLYEFYARYYFLRPVARGLAFPYFLGVDLDLWKNLKGKK